MRFIVEADNGVGRGAVMIVELDSASQIPHVTEPLMLTFCAVPGTGLRCRAMSMEG